MSLPINSNLPLGAPRVNGNANGVVNVDIGLAGGISANIIIATGLTKHPTVYKLIANLTLDQGTGSAAESILRALQTSATVVMYQVGLTQLNILVEAQGFGTDANLTTFLAGYTFANATGTAVGITSISSANGFLLA